MAAQAVFVMLLARRPMSTKTLFQDTKGRERKREKEREREGERAREIEIERER